MTRKITALITATLLMLALLPGGLAFAVENATAQLIAPANGADPVNVFPGQGQTVAIRVTNNPPSGGLPLPGLGATADPIRFVNVVLPSDAGFLNNSTALPAPENWTVHVGSGGPLQTIQFVANAGEAGILSGESLDFRFLSRVLRPLNGDRAGRFRVYVDDDRLGDNQVEAAAGSNGLTSTVRALRILPNTLGAISPPGVLDQSGTTGQEITYAFKVRNHARQSLNVVPELSSNSGSGDVITQGPPVTIAAGADEQVTSTVVLGAAATTDRVSTFTAEATATNANPASTRAPIAQAPFDVHRLVQLVLNKDDFQPTHVSNFENPTEYFFSLPVTKNASQGWTLQRQRDGVDVSTLTFCGNEVPLYGKLDAQGDRQAGDVVFAPGQNQNATLVFGPIVGDDIVSPSPSGEIKCDGDFVFEGPDGNGFPTVIDPVPIPDLITIDIRIPVIDIDITLPFDEDGDLQVRAKNGDDIQVSGDINLGCATLTRVALEHEGSGVIVETVRTASGWNNGVPCTGTADSFAVTFQGVQFGPDQTFALGDFLAVGEGVSHAERPGAGFSDVFKFDNWEPVFTEAQTAVITAGSYEGRHGVIVHFEDNGPLIGACDTQLWGVSGQGNVVFGSVEDVLYMNGQRCQRGQPGPDGGTDRILVIEGLDSIDDTPDVTYTPAESTLPITLGALPGQLAEPVGEVTGALGEVADELPLPVPFHQLPIFDPDRAKDGAGHFAVEETIRALVGILPPLPGIANVTRGNSQSGEPEEARQPDEDGPYWTRFNGADDIRVQVTRAQPGYLIRVMEATLDGEDCIVGAQQGGDILAGDENWVPVTPGADEDIYTFGIQLKNSFDWGPAHCLQVGLDQTAPVFDTVVRLSDESVQVNLTERLWGANVNSAWYAWEFGEWDEDEQTGGRVYYGATGVSGAEAEPQRTLTVDLQGTDGDFGGADYAPSSADTRRLEDKAGNPLAPTVEF